MGLQVFLFTQLEDWFDAFALRIASPLAFELSQRDVVLVPKLSHASVLETSLARRFGIAAGLEFDLPGRFLWSLTSASFAEVQGQAPFQAERLRWTIFKILETPELLPDSLAERVRALGTTMLPRFQLATRLAKAFEGYVVNRADWLQTWQDSESVRLGREGLRAHRPQGLIHAERFSAHESWQAWLWREILKRQGSILEEHPFTRFEREILSVAQTARSLGIARITIMGMPGLTMHQMRLFARLGQHLDIRWLLMNPCTSFWDDLPELARRSPEAFLPETPWLNELGPALLGLWGKNQRDYLSMLRELESSPDLKVNLGEVSLNYQELRQGALHELQDAIGTRSAFSWPPIDAKSVPARSSAIQIHACQSITHQLLVLREYLLRKGAGGAALKLSDCLILCADLEIARPAIHQVFGDPQASGRFAYRLARSPGERSALTSLILDTLGGSQSQFSLEQLSQCLSQTLYLLLSRLGPDEARTLLSALEDVGFVSNLSIKQGFEASFERLILGAAMDLPSTRDAFARDPSSQDRFGQSVLGRRAFAKLSLQELSRYDRVWLLFASFETLRTGSALLLEWIDKLDVWLTEWIEPIEHTRELNTLSDDLQEFRAILARVAQTYPLAEHGLPIDAAVFRQCLLEALEGGRPPGQLAGALNFVQLGSGLVPPTKLIAVLGMNHNIWPRHGFKDELDLTQAWIRSGDLSGYYQDRADLLEVLMAARQDLILLYQGIDPGDGNVLSPSSQVAELLTTLGTKALRHVMSIPASRQRELRLDAAAYEHLVQHYTERQARAHATSLDLVKSKKVIRLRELVDALLDPSRVVLRDWSMSLSESPALAEHEPLDQGVLGGNESGSLAWFAMEIATRLIKGEPADSFSAPTISNHPVFADGPVAVNMAEASLILAQSMVAKVRRSAVAGALPFKSRQVLLRLSGFEIQDHVLLGQDDTGRPMQVVLGRGSLTPNLLIRGYLSHCLLNAALEPSTTSILCLGKAGETVLMPFAGIAEASAALQAWLDFLEEGIREPKLFDGTTWLKEALMAHISSKKSSSREAANSTTSDAEGSAQKMTRRHEEGTKLTSTSNEESLEDGVPLILTKSAELLWKEARSESSVLEHRAGKLVKQILLCMEQAGE